MRTAWCMAALAVAVSGCAGEVQEDWERRAATLEDQAADAQALLAQRPQAEARFEAAARAWAALQPVTPPELLAVLGEGFTVETQSGLSFQVLLAHGAGTAESTATALERSATLEPRLTPTAVEHGPRGWTLKFITGPGEAPHVAPAPQPPVGPCEGRCVTARERAATAEQALGALRAQLGRLAVLESLERQATNIARNRKSIAHPWLPTMLALLRSSGEAPVWRSMQASRAEVRVEAPVVEAEPLQPRAPAPP